MNNDYVMAALRPKGNTKYLSDITLNKYYKYITTSKHWKNIFWVGGYTTERYLVTDIVNEYDYRVKEERERKIDEILGADTISV